MGAFFALEQVPSWVVVRFAPDTFAAGDEGKAWYPYFKVVPMVWSWAMWLAQRVHVKAHVRAGFSPSRIIVDGRPAPSLSTSEPVAMPYCDNGNIIGTCEEEVERAVTSVMAELRKMRLDLQDITGAVSEAEGFGVNVDGRRGRVRPSWRRLSKVVAACDFMSRRPKVTSTQMDRLLVVSRTSHFFIVLSSLSSML